MAMVVAGNTAFRVSSLTSNRHSHSDQVLETFKNFLQLVKLNNKTWCKTILKHSEMASLSCKFCLPYRVILQFRQAKTEIMSASKVAYRFLLGATSTSTVAPDSPTNSNRGTLFQGAWFKSLGTSGAKLSNDEDADLSRQKTKEVLEVPMQNSRAESETERV